MYLSNKMLLVYISTFPIQGTEIPQSSQVVLDA